MRLQQNLFTFPLFFFLCSGTQPSTRHRYLKTNSGSHKKRRTTFHLFTFTHFHSRSLGRTTRRRVCPRSDKISGTQMSEPGAIATGFLNLGSLGRTTRRRVCLRSDKSLGRTIRTVRYLIICIRRDLAARQSLRQRVRGLLFLIPSVGNRICLTVRRRKSFRTFADMFEQVL